MEQQRTSKWLDAFVHVNINLVQATQNKNDFRSTESANVRADRNALKMEFTVFCMNIPE